jgi:glycosyltransferase involved in cell wall biosynthesis
MASKRTWQQTPFIEGFLGVDNAFHKDVRANGGKLLLAAGLYLYHFYRADGDTSHAQRLTGPSEPVAAAGHVLFNFIFSHDESLRVSDYLELLEAGDWAVFQSANSIHCLKDWYPRIEARLPDTSKNTLLCLNSNLLQRDAPIGNDHLQHRAFAAELKVDVCNLEHPDASEIQAFVISRSLMERLSGPDSRAEDLPLLARNAEISFTVASDIYLQVLVDTPCRERDVDFVNWLSARNRVAILTLGFWPSQAGMEMFIHNLAWRMTEDGDEVVLFTPKPDVEFEEIERNYMIRRYRSEDELISLIGKHHLSLPFDCLLVQGAHTAATLALKAKAAFDIPVILRTHGEDIQIDEDIGYGYRLIPKLATEIEHNIRNVDHHVVIGSHVEADVRGIDPDATVSVINNGVDIDRFTVEKSNYLREWLNIPAETRILLSVGRNHPKKCFHYAVDALARLRAIGADVCLVHVGRKGKGIDLEQRAREQGVSARFYHPGPVNYFDTPKVYSSADIFLFPSKQETFGNVTVEAMSSGLPCVEFDYGANHDKIDNGHDGFIVPFGDIDAFVASIRSLLDDDRNCQIPGGHRYAGSKGRQPRGAYVSPECPERYTLAIDTFFRLTVFQIMNERVHSLLFNVRVVVQIRARIEIGSRISTFVSTM